MSSWSNTAQTAPAGQKRWQKILALDPHTWLKNIHQPTKHYQVFDLRPIYSDLNENRVERFQVISSGEEVWVSFLRLMSDNLTCSLGGETR